MSEAAIAAKFLGEAGIFGLGWALFFWAMWLLRIERKRSEDLTVHVIEYLTKLQMYQRNSDDVDSIKNFFGGAGSKERDSGT